jgi:hypothetical protein
LALRSSPLLKFGEWFPDQPAFENPGATQAKNVKPIGQDYGPVRSLEPDTDALPDRCRGFFTCIASDGVPHTFAATDSAIYKRNGTSWNDVTRLSGPYTGTQEFRWKFIQYGDLVIATNGVDDMQKFDLLSDTAFSSISGAPKARRLAIVNNFVVAAYTFDGENGNLPQGVRWSALDNPEDWTASVTTQSDAQRIEGYGSVAGIVGSQNAAVVVLENAIYRMEYVGGETIFAFTIQEENRGSKIPGSVVSYGGRVFYRGEDGFYMFAGGESIPIGDDKVDEWFDETLSVDGAELIWAAIDPRSKVYMIGFPSTTNGLCDRIAFYNWVSNRWGYAEAEVEAVGRVLTEAANVDDFDIPVDDIDISVDSAQYAGGRAILGAFNGSHQLGYFTGTPLDATIETTEAQLNENGRAFVGSITVLGDYETATVGLKVRDLPNVEPVEIAPVAPEANGECCFEVDAKYHRAVVNLTGEWRRVKGIKLRYRETGA